MKARCKHRGRPSAHSSRLARREMNHLNQKVTAQNGASSSGVPHGRGTPVEEDNSKGHCRPGGRRGGIPGDSCLSRKNPRNSSGYSPTPLSSHQSCSRSGSPIRPDKGRGDGSPKWRRASSQRDLITRTTGPPRDAKSRKRGVRVRARSTVSSGSQELPSVAIVKSCLISPSTAILLHLHPLDSTPTSNVVKSP